MNCATTNISAGLAGETATGICPRCGADLVRGKTSAGKVCFRCPVCGGVSVTLPAIRESLGDKGVAALAGAARTAEHVGCNCPGCGGTMSILKVGDGAGKVEIDVCGRCLSVWCDKGEYEALAPPPLPKSEEEPLLDILKRASPEARERYAAKMLDALPEDNSPSDFEIGEVLCDVARLVVGAPTLWRDVRPQTPILAILLSLSLPIAQVWIHYAIHGFGSEGIRIFSLSRDFCVLTLSMANKLGFSNSSPLSALTFPFVQFSGIIALGFASTVFLPFAVIENRIGHGGFLRLFLAFAVTTTVSQAVAEAVGLADGRLCGITPIAVGYFAYICAAWPEMHTREGNFRLMSVYASSFGLLMVVFTAMFALPTPTLSAGLVPVVACLALGVFLGRKKNSNIFARALKAGDKA